MLSWQSLVMYAVVIGVGLPAAFHFRCSLAIRNITAIALIVAWLAGELVTLGTGDSLPIGFYLVADITVIAVIYAKAISRAGSKIYDGWAHQLRCLITDLTPYDRWIIAIFVLGQWPLYILNIADTYKWGFLAGLSAAQFLLAGGEALTSFFRSRRRAKKANQTSGRHSLIVRYPAQRRGADAVRNPSGSTDDQLIAKGISGYG